MTNEHEMRVTRNGRAVDASAIREALAALDPDATARIAAETGIAHVHSRLDTLAILDALASAGLEGNAATG